MPYLVFSFTSSEYNNIISQFILFIILWVYSGKSRPVGAITGLALFFYGCFRFFVEFFRMPDAHLGFLALNWVTMGQILSLPMIIIGYLLFHYAYKKTV